MIESTTKPTNEMVYGSYRRFVIGLKILSWFGSAFSAITELSGFYYDSWATALDFYGLPYLRYLYVFLGISAVEFLFRIGTRGFTTAVFNIAVILSPVKNEPETADLSVDDSQAQNDNQDTVAEPAATNPQANDGNSAKSKIDQDAHLSLFLAEAYKEQEKRREEP